MTGAGQPNYVITSDVRTDRRIFASSRASRHAFLKMTGFWVCEDMVTDRASAEAILKLQKARREAFQTGVCSPRCRSEFSAHGLHVV